MHRLEEAEPVSTIAQWCCFAVSLLNLGQRLAFAFSAASDDQVAILACRGVGAYRTEVRPSASTFCALRRPPGDLGFCSLVP